MPEAVDVDTGEVQSLAVNSKDLYKYKMVTVEGQRRWVPLVDLPKPVQYSPLVADMVCAAVLQGTGIEAACTQVGLTYRDYVGWRKMYPEFGEMVDEARKDRAEIFFEKLERVAEETEAEEEAIALGRLKADIYKHLSEVSDSGRFGRTTKVNAKVGISAIHVETGVRRPGDTGFKEAELFKEIEAGQKVIIEADLNIIPVLGPANLPKKMDEL